MAFAGTHEIKIPKEGDYVPCLCWCTRKIVSVRIEAIWAKQTDSCGHPNCAAELVSPA